MLKTFKIGGVHPPENKLSAQGEIITLPLPEQVTIPLSQHIGAPAVPTVKKGDQVKVGQIIGQAAGFISANIHSSVSGTVMSLDPVIDASGYPRPAVTIKVEGDEFNRLQACDIDQGVECTSGPYSNGDDSPYRMIGTKDVYA